MSEKIVIGGSDALAIIDMQNDFCNEDGALYVRGVDGEVPMSFIIANVDLLTTLPFGLSATTEDVHTVDHVECGIFGRHCIIGTVGQDTRPELDKVYAGVEMNLSKGIDDNIISYSISTSPGYGIFIKTLRQKMIRRIFLCGLAYTHCVGESAIALSAQGFEVYVVRDATRSVPPPYGNPEVMAQKLALYGVKEVNADQLVG